MVGLETTDVLSLLARAITVVAVHDGILSFT